jgi:hypothetical protein
LGARKGPAAGKYWDAAVHYRQMRDSTHFFYDEKKIDPVNPENAYRYVRDDRHDFPLQIVQKLL